MKIKNQNKVYLALTFLLVVNSRLCADTLKISIMYNNKEIIKNGVILDNSEMTFKLNNIEQGDILKFEKLDTILLDIYFDDRLLHIIYPSLYQKDTSHWHIKRTKEAKPSWYKFSKRKYWKKIGRIPYYNITLGQGYHITLLMDRKTKEIWW